MSMTNNLAITFNLRVYTLSIIEIARFIESFNYTQKKVQEFTYDKYL